MNTVVAVVSLWEFMCRTGVYLQLVCKINLNWIKKRHAFQSWTHLIDIHWDVFVFMCVGGFPTMPTAVVHMAHTPGRGWQQHMASWTGPTCHYTAHNLLPQQAAGVCWDTPIMHAPAWAPFRSLAQLTSHMSALSSLLSWMLIIIVLITSQCAAEMLQRTACWHLSLGWCQRIRFTLTVTK